MSVKSKLLGLFNWRTASPPRDVIRKGDSDPETGYQYGSNPYHAYENSVKPPYERRRKYDIYDELDELGDINSVLTAYAEDSTQHDREKKAKVWVTSNDTRAQEILKDLLKRVGVEEWAEACTRDIGKYGDDFCRLDIDYDKMQIRGVDWLDPRDVERIENNQGILAGFERTELLEGVQNAWNRGEQNHKLTWDPWDIVHFRNYKKKREPKQRYRNIYGTSLLDGAERIGKQVKILDDMLVVQRLLKSLDQRVYKVDTGRSSPEEEILILKRWKNAMKRKPYINPADQRFDSNFDPTTFQEDIFWPQRDGSTSTVDVIKGQPGVADIVDIDHFTDKLFGTLRAPKAYFGHEGDVNAKATLSQQDMKWGRSCNSLQSAFKQGLVRLCQIELALNDIDVDVEFEIGMVVPSVLEDLSRLEAMNTLVDICDRMASLGEKLKLDETQWKTHLLRLVLGLTDEEIERFDTKPDPIPVLPVPDLDAPAQDKEAKINKAEIIMDVFSTALQRRRFENFGFVPHRASRLELPSKEFLEGKRASSNPSET